MVLPGLVRCSAEVASVAASVGSTGDFGGGRARGGEGDLGETEIENFGVAAFGDENIRGLDVAVNDVFGVRGVERVGDFDGEREEVFDIHGAAVDAVLERLAVEKFHGDEGLAVLFADVVNGADVGMVERGGRLRFALETGEGLGIAGDILRQKFQRDETLEARVFGLVDDTHASAAEFFDDAVMRDGLADWRRGVCHARTC